MNTHMNIVEADMSESLKAEIAQRQQDEETLKKAYKFSLKGGGILTIICVVLWPLPLYFSGYVFDLGFYSMWVGIAIVWVSVAAFTSSVCQYGKQDKDSLKYSGANRQHHHQHQSKFFLRTNS